MKRGLQTVITNTTVNCGTIKQRLIGLFSVQEGVDGAYFGLVILVGLDGIVAVEILYIGDLVMQIHIAAKVSWYRLKLIVWIGCVNVEG